MTFIHIDIDKASETLPNILTEISSVPTFYFYKNGAKVNSFTGGNPKKLNELVDKLKESPSTNSNQSVDDKILEDKKAINIENSDNYKNLIAQGKSVVHFNAIWCIPSQVFKINPNQSLKIKR